MREVALLSAAAAAALLGCASCDGTPPGGDADTDADADTDTDADSDADADVDRPDAEEHELPDPEPVELIELPPGRPGMECGVGCRQISFADSVFRDLDYDVGDRKTTTSKRVVGRRRSITSTTPAPNRSVPVPVTSSSSRSRSGRSSGPARP